MLEEAEYNDLIISVEHLNHRVASTDSTSSSEETRSIADFTKDSTSPLTRLDVLTVQNTKTEFKALPDHLEYAFLEDGQQNQ